MTWLTSTLFSLFLLWIMLAFAMTAAWASLVELYQWRRRREMGRRYRKLGLL